MILYKSALSFVWLEIQSGVTHHQDELEGAFPELVFQKFVFVFNISDYPLVGKHFDLSCCQYRVHSSIFTLKTVTDLKALKTMFVYRVLTIIDFDMN